MFIARAIGWLLMVLAVAAGGYELFSWLETGDYRMFSVGEMWAVLDRSSLLLLQTAVQPRVWPWLWNDVILTALKLPAWAMLLALGGMLAALCRVRYGRHSRLR